MSSSSLAASWPCVLRTPRLALRPAEAADAPAFIRLWTDAEVRRYLGGPVAQDRLGAYRRHFAGRPGLFAVTARDTAAVLGSVTIDTVSRFAGRREVSYSFLPEHWGHGYAREAVAAAIDWAFDHVPSQDPSVVAVTQEANLRSRLLLEAVGMRLVETFVEWDAPQTLYAVRRAAPA
ncbi:GNAT family N-acetyltransferase [Streptomyces sp. Ru71]|uniref:GNAT family N-acetyltransferase n=1 Tax=Streptomyces sp. Ru71 TaxID=2080746 RepID=UPI0021563996|nr:GNAT family N-acetyltransferase [Streptomyces sp. Ru71]